MPRKDRKRKIRKPVKRARPQKKQKRQRGPKSFLEQAELFKNAGQRSQIQLEKNALRDSETMKNIRYGFKLMWQEVPQVMKRYKIGECGSFDPRNGHGGVCWGWPKECKLKNSQAKTIIWDIWKKRGLTYPQMKKVRQALAYAYELSGGSKPGGNFQGVSQVWKNVHPDQCVESSTTTLPQSIPTPAELKVAFTQQWNRQHPWCLMRYLQGLVQSYDLFVFGIRSREDIDRVKKSTQHHHNWKRGWQATSFLGGRCKLQGVKKNTRPWKVYRRCHCPGGKHIQPPSDFCKEIGDNGNPKVEVKWNTTCPLAALQLIWQFQGTKKSGPKRCYGRWLESGRYGTSNTGDIAEMAVDWMIAQGACTEEDCYDTNSGRKSLAKWCAHLNIPYTESFHIHADLYGVWAENYEQEVEKPAGNFKKRDQSNDPKVATAALMKFANFLGRGKKVKVKLSKKNRYLHALLMNAGQKEKAERIRLGIESSSDESSDSDAE